MGPAPVDEDHPVAAVLALEARHAPTEPSLLPRLPGSPAPGHLTPSESGAGDAYRR